LGKEHVAGAVRLRRPRPRDAAAIWSLVRASKALDVNSPYAYLLVCSHFAATSVVAERGDSIVGLVAAYARPDRLVRRLSKRWAKPMRRTRASPTRRNRSLCVRGASAVGRRCDGFDDSPRSDASDADV
jgi:hypothetical protein